MMRNISCITNLNQPIPPNNLISALVKDELKVITVADSSIMVMPTKRGQFPMRSVPDFLASDAPGNTYHKNILYIDSLGIKDIEYDFRFLSGSLSLAYADPMISEDFNSVNTFAGKVYINWVSRSITQRLGLPLEDRLKMDVVLAAFYVQDGAYTDDYTNKNREHQLIQSIANITGHSASEVVSILDSLAPDNNYLDSGGVPSMESVTPYLKNISAEMDLKINENTIVQVTSNSWYGTGATYQCIAAVNYRPFFIAMVYTAIKSPSFKRARFTTLINDYVIGKDKDQANRFLRTIEHIQRGLDIKEA